MVTGITELRHLIHVRYICAGASIFSIGWLEGSTVQKVTFLVYYKSSGG